MRMTERIDVGEVVRAMAAEYYAPVVSPVCQAVRNARERFRLLSIPKEQRWIAIDGADSLSILAALRDCRVLALTHQNAGTLRTIASPDRLRIVDDTVEGRANGEFKPAREVASEIAEAGGVFGLVIAHITPMDLGCDAFITDRVDQVSSMVSPGGSLLVHIPQWEGNGHSPCGVSLNPEVIAHLLSQRHFEIDDVRTLQAEGYFSEPAEGLDGVNSYHAQIRRTLETAFGRDVLRQPVVAEHLIRLFERAPDSCFYIAATAPSE